MRTAAVARKPSDRYCYCYRRCPPVSIFDSRHASHAPNGRKSLSMKEQTIYSYKLIYRFRWRFAGFFLQLASLAGLLAVCALVLRIRFDQLFLSTAVFPILPLLHLLLLKLYGYSTSTQLTITADSLISPWWGAGTRFPVPIRFFQGAELTVCTGSLLIPAACFVWLPSPYGLTLIVWAIVLLLPRVAGLLSSIGRPKQSQVQYGVSSISFLRTDV